ncbi:MAG TPA: DUF3800 domain-containing protein [Methanofastidiosum sp.]|jgi:hypothetical protein|nr:DUF3800 domain-containing protein [Methanofastidiosum sp.]
MKYRLYIDEVGNSDLGASNDPNHRYLSLTGVIFELTYVQEVVFQQVEDLKKRYFNSHPDDPVILHRKEIVNKRPPFDNLLDPTIEESFNKEILSLMTNLDYIVISVVIDKLEHKNRYQTWRSDPYHYCLKILIERYVLWLKEQRSVGDVMAESRGGKEDRRLKDSFERVYQNGTEYLKSEMFSAYLTSRQLKVKLKSNNIAGLQIADLIAHPSYRAILAHHNHENLPDNFGGKVAWILECSKYYRSSSGEVDGYGQKWLP